jgi:hypothetical protein
MASLGDLRQRFLDGIISQEQYNLEQKAIIADMSDSARRRRGAHKLKSRGTYAQVESEETALAVKYGTPVAPEESLYFHYEATFHEREAQENVVKSRDAELARVKRTLQQTRPGGVSPTGGEGEKIRASLPELTSSEFDDIRWKVRESTTEDLERSRVKELDMYYRGVTFNRYNGKWAARLLNEGQSLSLGYFNTEGEAVAASNIYQDAKWAPAHKPSVKRQSDRGPPLVRGTAEEKLDRLSELARSNHVAFPPPAVERLRERLNKVRAPGGDAA